MNNVNKEEAIKIIKQIQNGEWDRNCPEPPKGKMTINVWDNSLFSYGMEYGAIVALMQIFSISKEEL